MSDPEYRLAKDPGKRQSVRTALNGYLDTLAADKTFIVVVRRETRSLAQNAYIWSGVYPCIVNFMREHHGRDYSSDAIHETLKELFLPFRVEQMKNKEIRIYRTTKELTKVEFGEYLENVFRWAAAFGCVIPEPTWPDWKVKQAEEITGK